MKHNSRNNQNMALKKMGSITPKFPEYRFRLYYNPSINCQDI